jgi:hypothetical protein
VRFQISRPRCGRMDGRSGRNAGQSTDWSRSPTGVSAPRRRRRALGVGLYRCRPARGPLAGDCALIPRTSLPPRERRCGPWTCVLETGSDHAADEPRARLGTCRPATRRARQIGTGGAQVLVLTVQRSSALDEHRSRPSALAAAFARQGAARRQCSHHPNTRPLPNCPSGFGRLAIDA